MTASRRISAVLAMVDAHPKRMLYRSTLSDLNSTLNANRGALPFGLARYSRAWAADEMLDIINLEETDSSLRLAMKV